MKPERHDVAGGGVRPQPRKTAQSERARRGTRPPGTGELGWPGEPAREVHTGRPPRQGQGRHPRKDEKGEDNMEILPLKTAKSQTENTQDGEKGQGGDVGKKDAGT